MRKPLLLALFLVAATAACTSLLGDFTFKGGVAAGPDGAPGDDGGINGDETGTYAAIGSNSTVYVDTQATLDGSQSTGPGPLSYQWSFASETPGGPPNIPAHSVLTNSSIVMATSQVATFVPDVAGTYVLSLKVSGPDGGNTAAVTVTAILPQVFYAQGAVSAAGPSAAYALVDFDGGNAHPVVCPETVMPSGAVDQIANAAAYGSRIYDFWESPDAAQSSEFAGFLVDYTPPPSQSYTAHLYSGTAASLCDAGVNDLGALTGGSGRPYGADPHFSPDGSRIVVYDRAFDIVTYAFGGGSVHTVVMNQAFGTLDPSGATGSPPGAVLQGYVQEPPRVEWMPPGSSTDLAWAVPLSGGVGWQIMTAQDVTGATPSTFMTCTTGVVPREIAILPDHTVIASYRQTPTSGENLVQLSGQCATMTRYTNVGDSSAAIATDFAVSPDHSQIAFLQIDPTVTSPSAAPWMVEADDASAQLPGGYVYVVPVVGGTPTKISTTPALYGPRWIGGGTNLVFTGLKSLSDAGLLATTVVIVQADGGAEHAVAAGDGVSTFVSTSGSAACNTAPGSGGRAPGTAAWLALAAIVELVRRRRRR